MLVQIRLWTRCAAAAAIIFVTCVSTWAQNAAIVPVPRAQAWWTARHDAINERVKQANPNLLMIGDSITQGWEAAGKALWDQYYAPRNAVNLGISGDRTEHVLWRLENGNIEGIKPKVAVIMIGTNNSRDNSAQEIAAGVAAIVEKLRTELPDTKLLLLAIFPRERTPSDYRAKLTEASAAFSKLADGKMVHYLDIADVFLEEDGTLPEAVMPDALHPNEEGYRRWAAAMEPKLKELLGE